MHLRALMGCYVFGFFYILLFCDNYVVAESKAGGLKLSLSTDDGSRCSQKKDSVTLRCTLSHNNVNKSTSWNIVWRREGELIGHISSRVFRNTTTLTSILTVYVNWPKDKVFTCFAEDYEDELPRDPAMNASVTLGMLPQPTAIHGVRFMEGSDEKIVEVYWKSNEGCNYTYDLTYTIEDDLFGEQVYKINDTECYNRINDVYRVPNTTGYICKGSIKDAAFQEFLHYSVLVKTINGQCQMTGPIKKFKLYSIGIDHWPNQDNIALMPLPVNMINVSVARRQVKLTWQNPKGVMKNRWYRLTYNCSGAAEQEDQIVEITEKSLYTNNFPSYKPYAICSFCIRVYLEKSYVSSLPFCREARLHEEKPSKPPRITCEGNECATTDDEHFRNVTITWSLPPRETWNGVLKRVVVIYQRVGNESTNRKSITEHNITKGFTKLTMLARNWRYLVQAAVCNKEGCSDYGNATVLSAKALPVRMKESKSGDSSNNLSLTVSLLTGLFCATLIVIGVIMGVRKRSTEQIIRENSLPSLAEPDSHNYHNVSTAQTQKEYDHLEERNGNVALESIRNSQETIS